MKRIMSILLVSVISEYAYIYEIKVMKASNALQKRDHYIIGLSDFHDKQHPANVEQRSQFLSLLDSIQSKQEYAILTEDLSSANIQGSYASHSYALGSRLGMLAGLTQDCKQRGFVTDNLEYRFGRVIALGHLLHQPRMHPFQHQPACKISIGDLITEVKSMMDHVKKRVKGNMLTSLYMRTCTKITRAIKRLNLRNYCESSCASFLHCCTNHENREAFLKDLLTFDSRLLDCSILCEIEQIKNTRNIIIVAGGTHIARTFEQLAHMGYALDQTTQEQKDGNGIRTLLSTSLLRQGQRPAPIALDLLDKYLK